MRSDIFYDLLPLPDPQPSIPIFTLPLISGRKEWDWRLESGRGCLSWGWGSRVPSQISTLVCFPHPRSPLLSLWEPDGSSPWCWHR